MSTSILKGIHRRVLGINPNDQVVAPQGVMVGGEGKPAAVLAGDPNYVAIFDDFLGDLIGDAWATVEGDTGYTQGLQTGTNGVYRILSSNTGTLAPTSASALTSGLFLNWKANQRKAREPGRLRLSARVKLENITRTGDRIHAFIGFSDSGGAEMPAYDTGAGVISNAADCVGFLFSPGGDTGWSLVAAKSIAGDSGDQLSVPVVAAVANTYDTLELEVFSPSGDTGATAHFWINGVKRGQIHSPVASSVALTPWVGMWVQDTGDQYMDIDFITISAPRDTGL
jgi:hypothetical protein